MKKTIIKNNHLKQLLKNDFENDIYIASEMWHSLEIESINYQNQTLYLIDDFDDYNISFKTYFKKAYKMIGQKLQKYTIN